MKSGTSGHRPVLVRAALQACVAEFWCALAVHHTSLRAEGLDLFSQSRLDPKRPYEPWAAGVAASRRVSVVRVAPGLAYASMVSRV